MAMKTNAPCARIDAVKTDLQSISRCTNTTVAELQELLGGKTVDPSQKENIRGKNSQPATGRRKAGAEPGTTTTTTALPPRDKYVLATEVANATLRLLAEALKVQTSPRAQPQTKHAKASPTSHTPLRERSVSQISNSPQKPRKLRQSSSQSSLLTSGQDSGLLATAECARAAFSYLATPEAAKIAGKDGPEFQLENGILALIGKLVALGLDNMAIKELRQLKRRIDRHLGRKPDKQDTQAANTKPGARAATIEKESFVTLLDFGEINTNSALIPIIASLQTYTLRIIAKLRRPRLVDACWEYLKLSNSSSPANLMWHIAQGTKSQAKGTRQLESLAQIVISLCPSVSNLEDESTLQPSPDIVFLLQHLAFKIRQRWWKIAKHQSNEEKELVEPFSKCLSAFSRRSKSAPLKKYKVAESLATDLLDLKDKSTTIESGAYFTLARHLGFLAQAAGLFTEALRWLQTPDSADGDQATGTRSATRLVRMATISLEVTLKSEPRPELESAVDEALDVLSGSLSGTRSELDALFVEAHGLRRAASRVLVTGNIEGYNDSDVSPQQLSMRAIEASIHFAARFVGVAPPPDAEPVLLARHGECVAMSLKFAKSTIDSVVACYKRSQYTEEHWDFLDRLTQDCASFLHRIEDNKDDDYDMEAPGPSYSSFVKLSNACWAYLLQLRKAGVKTEVVAAAMQRSVDLLLSRPQGEQEAGMLTVKLERLGEIFDGLEKAKDSRDAYYQAIKTHLDAGMAEEIAEASSTHVLEQLFESGCPAETIGRLLKSYHRSFQKFGLRRTDERAYFDDLNLASVARGAILEWQLRLYVKTLSRNRQWDMALNASIQAIKETLLTIHEPTSFPLRNRRVSLLFMQLVQARSDVLTDGQLRYEVSSDVALENTEDRGLARFEDYFKTMFIFKNTMQDPSPSLAILRQCFTTWETLTVSASSWKGLANCVDQLDYWLQEIQGAADYLAAKGEEYLCLPVLHLLVRIYELENSMDPSNLVSSLCRLGLQYLHLGYSGKAGLTFAKAGIIAVNGAASTEAKLRWHIGYAEYLLAIGSISKCQSNLTEAHTVAQNDTQFMALAKPSTTMSGRVRFNRILADACHVYSLLATYQGHHVDAARHARQCVILNRRIWAALESKSSSAKGQCAEAESTTSIKSESTLLSSMRNEKGVPLVMSVTHDALDGADFWCLIPPLYRGLMQHSLVLANQGLLQESVQVSEQAEKIASASRSRSLVLENASCRADCWTQSGRPDKAQSILEGLGQNLYDRHLSMASYYSALARMQHSLGKFDEELELYGRMEQLLANLSSSSYSNTLDVFTSSVDALAEQVSQVSLNDTSKSATSTRGRRQAAKPAPRTAPKTTKSTAPRGRPRTTATKPTGPRATAAPKANESPNATEQCLTIQSLKVDVAQRKVLAALVQENIKEALDLLAPLQELEHRLQHDISHQWVKFKAILSQSVQQLTQDVTYNTLPESTIALPSIASTDSSATETTVGKKTVPSKTPRGGRAKKANNEETLVALREARERLAEAHSLCASAGSNHNFYQLSLALSQVTVFLSAMSGSDKRGSLHPLFAAYMSEIPKCNSLRLAQGSVEVEREQMGREEYLKWPSTSSAPDALVSADDFQKDYIDIIPKTWTAVSFTLSDTHDELYITRYESGVTPFVLRLPLKRQVARDQDEPEFSFEDGKRDFEEIIELSDFSTRTAKDMTTKEARAQWWDEREALDTRLQELLQNIENIWLGGFKGIFSQHARQPDLLARFRKSFENILNRHLPSRKKKPASKPPSLDARVHELFIGLGDPSTDGLDLDDALTDLIYFVFDILQFNGEHNAYDEIDFDTIVIETKDALQAYHDACSASSSAATTSSHMILILDKNLHLFPWESMPCLQNLSISRLPSLASLRERLLAARAPSSAQSNAPAGHYVPTTTDTGRGGTSILNPSGDLSHTAKVLKPYLDTLSSSPSSSSNTNSWTHITNRAPSEPEFESALRNKDLLLYFGHGSGAQFVRSKSVRRLYNHIRDEEGDEGEDGRQAGCATTLLLGCSSVHLTENGIFEPSGMLASYLLAGAPAVVGMLWDVTDKDCDRFAVRVGEVWGLWGGGECEESSKKKESASSAAPKTPGKKAGRGGGNGNGKGNGKGRVAQLVEEVEVEGARTPSAAPGTTTRRKPTTTAATTTTTSTRKRGGRRVATPSPSPPPPPTTDDDSQNGSKSTKATGKGLDEAVHSARNEACYLRYLNGAAAVVYGIPVFLE